MLTNSGGAPVSINSIDNSNSDDGEKKVAEDNSVIKTSSEQDTDNKAEISTSNDKADPTSLNKNSKNSDSNM